METTPLSAADRARLERTLRERQRELRTSLAAQLAGSEDANVVGLRNRLEDSDDWAVADALSELDLAFVARDLRLLAEVQAALGRIAKGDYGDCVDCGEPIPLARLAANPAALRCVSCQERVEKRFAG